MFDDRHKFDTDNLRLLLDKYVISFLDNFYFFYLFRRGFASSCAIFISIDVYALY